VSKRRRRNGILATIAVVTGGNKMSFEVASVKPSKMPKPHRFPLDAGNALVPGGRTEC